MDHLRYAGLPLDEQRRVFLDIIWSDPICREALTRAVQAVTRCGELSRM